MSETPDWAVHPELLSCIERIRAFENDGAAIEDVPLQHCGGFFICPVLSAEGANYFLRMADALSSYFVPNEHEGREYQIPEVVLAQHDATAHAQAAALAEEYIWPLFKLMYGQAPNNFASIQLARYSAPGNLGTGWHHDEDSEATCVISLSPERHRGGGTGLRPGGAVALPYTLPPLPKGWALLFNGRTTLHRGLPVEEGERNLLVYWMNHVKAKN